ncbi:DNA repair protein rhp54 [Hordeum vulgare]|nr:DNA repair protein rhp54 [Hordeum vulgare]
MRRTRARLLLFLGSPVGGIHHHFLPKPSRPTLAMGDDLDAAAGLASSGKGKPRAPRKAAAPKPKKVLTPEQRAKESAKRKDRRYAANARDEAIAATAAQQQVTNAAATRETLCMLGLNPSQHGLVNAAVATAVSTGSSAFPRTMLPDSPDASACNPVPDFHVYPQASRLSGECSPEVSVVAPSAPAPIDLNATPMVTDSLAGGARKHARQTPTDQLPGARNLSDGIADRRRRRLHAEHDLRGWCVGRWLRSRRDTKQDGRGAFTAPAGYNEDQAAFMRDQVGLDLDGFPLDLEFPKYYGLEEEDECDIEAEPLFEDELANQTDGTKPKRKSKRTKA